jgi:cobalamin synthase
LSFQVKLAEVNSSLLIFKKYENKWTNLILNTIFLVPLSFNQLMFCDLIIVPWLIASWLIYAWLKYKLKGHNGDSMGAGLELSEALFYSMLAVLF